MQSRAGLEGPNAERGRCRAGPAWRASPSTRTRALSARPEPLSAEPRPGSLRRAVVSALTARGGWQEQVLLVYLLCTKSTFLRHPPTPKGE